MAWGGSSGGLTSQIRKGTAIGKARQDSNLVCLRFPVMTLEKDAKMLTCFDLLG